MSICGELIEGSKENSFKVNSASTWGERKIFHSEELDSKI